MAKQFIVFEYDTSADGEVVGKAVDIIRGKVTELDTNLTVTLVQGEPVKALAELLHPSS